MTLQIQNVSRSFGGVRALDRVSFDVARGTVHAITGENGAGKSTLMRIIAGLDRADSGEVRFHGRGIAMIHQELLAFPSLTVAENVCMGREPVRWGGWLDRRAMKQRAEELLARLGVAMDCSRPMSELSVAEQQCVEIAKAMGRDADLIIMDEPTSALSAREAELLFRIIGDLKRRGATILYISHRMQEIFWLADRITILRDGRHVATEAAGALDERRLIALMVGREVDTSIAKGPVERGEVVLEVHGPVSLTLRRGEVLGLAGLMGAGRTELAQAIFGVTPGTAGEIFLDGCRVSIRSPAEALARGIALVTEDRKRFGLMPDLPVKANLTLANLARFGWGPFLCGRAEDEAADEQMRAFGVRAAGRNQQARNLSGGNQQKIIIARSLLCRPRILILDEPTRGIDVGAKAEIYSLIARLAREGMAILLISSEMNEVLALSDRILVMREGQAVAEVEPANTTPEQILAYAMPG
jgi:ABC-type sugar transport system ATPase subunit